MHILLVQRYEKKGTGFSYQFRPEIASPEYLKNNIANIWYPRTLINMGEWVQQGENHFVTCETTNPWGKSDNREKWHVTITPVMLIDEKGSE